MMFYLKIIFLNNYKLKLVAFLFSCCLWIYVQNAKYSQISINTPIEYINLSEDLDFAKKPTRYVKVVIKGIQENLKFSTSELKLIVDLSDAIAGNNQVDTLFDTNSLPDNVKLISFPQQIDIKLNKIEQKQVWVTPEFTGELEKGYKKGSIIIVPKQIYIKGDTNRLKYITNIKTQPIDINKRSKKSIFNVRLVKPFLKANLSVKKVKVTLDVINILVDNEKYIEKISIQTLKLDPALQTTLSNKFISLQITGESQYLNNLTSKDFVASINLEETQYNQETNHILPFDYEPSIPIQVNLLKYKNKVRVTNIEPKEVSVRFSINPKFNKSTPNE